MFRSRYSRLSLVAFFFSLSPAMVSADEESPSPLIPKGELARMADRPVTENIAYRPGSGLSIESDDGDFNLTLRARLQILGSVSADDGEAAALELQLRRARFTVQGHFFGEDNRYKLELALSPRDQGVRDSLNTGTPSVIPLLDFYLEFQQLRDLSVRVGQYKVPFSRQRVVSSSELQLVDRSIANAEFNLDRDIGFDLHSKDLFGLDLLRYHLGAYIARGRNGVGLDDFGLMYLARVELSPLGLFDDSQLVDFERSFRPRLSIGAAYAYLDRARFDRGILGAQPVDGGTSDMHTMTADLLFQWAGLSLYSDAYYRSAQRRPGTLAPAALDRDGFGGSAQAGYLIPRLPLELAARYAAVRGVRDSALEDNNQLGGGVNWYFAQHAFKIQLDYFRYWPGAGAGSHEARLSLQGSL